MPFTLIPAILGTSFVLIWAFICGMMLRDGQMEARRRREIEEHLARARSSRRRNRRGRSRAIEMA